LGVLKKKRYKGGALGNKKAVGRKEENKNQGPKKSVRDKEDFNPTATIYAHTRPEKSKRGGGGAPQRALTQVRRQKGGIEQKGGEDNMVGRGKSTKTKGEVSYRADPPQDGWEGVVGVNLVGSIRVLGWKIWRG